MKTSYILALLLCIAPLHARENPFFAIDPSMQTTTSNQIESIPSLDSVSYALPDHARLLKEVNFTFQNADGSYETRKLIVDRSIDWHKVLVISQESGTIPPTYKTTQEGSQADFGFIRFSSNGKHLIIKAADPIERHFVLTNPNRIVIDFKRSKRFDKIEKALNAPPYLGVTLTNHKKFVRATITLDGKYRYSLNRSGDTINIRCK